MQTVFLAVQDQDSQRLLSAVCKDKGCKTITSDNLSQLLQIIQAEDIDILFLDLKFPGLDVEYILSAINEIMKELPVIIIAREPDISNEIKVRKRKIFYFAHQPLNPVEIEHVLQSAIDAVSLRKPKTESAFEESVVLETIENQKGKRKQCFNTVVNMSLSVIRKIQTTDRKITNQVKHLILPRLDSELTDFIKDVKLADKFLTNTFCNLLNVSTIIESNLNDK